MRTTILGWTVVVLLAAGCGSSNSSTCDAFVNGLNAYASKAAPCGGSGLPSGLTKDTCTDALSHSGCTDADKQKFTDFGNCLSAMPTCNPADVTSFDTALSNCVSKLSGVSPNC